MKLYSLLCIIFISAHAAAQVRVATIGTISKIDEKGKTISLAGAASAMIEAPKESPEPARETSGREAPRGQRGGKNGGSTDRPDTGQKNYPVPSGSPERIPKNAGAMNFKVRILPATLFKDGDKDIKFGDLKVGDTVEVMSPKPGLTLDATEVLRTPKEGK